MNVITFDIEEWALAKSGGYGSPELYARYDVFLNRILDSLDDAGCKATFFCTGQMGRDFPTVVKTIMDRGHEIGCHSFNHTWMNEMSVDDARSDTFAAVDALEQCIGRKVTLYRAPAFSIGEANIWMYEILAECGIEKDASIYPSSRDFGGFPSFGHNRPCIIEKGGVRMKEFPIRTAVIAGRDMAFSGGGYFRFLPLKIVEREMARSSYSMSYFHIGDLLPELNGIQSRVDFEAYYKIPGTFRNRAVRYLKSNFGKKRAMGKLLSLLGDVHFISMSQADSLIDWETAPVVKL